MPVSRAGSGGRLLRAPTALRHAREIRLSARRRPVPLGPSVASGSPAPRRAASATAGPRSPAEAAIATSWPSGSRASSCPARRATAWRHPCIRALTLSSRVGPLCGAGWPLPCRGLVMVRQQAGALRPPSRPWKTLAGTRVSPRVACELGPSAWRIATSRPVPHAPVREVTRRPALAAAPPEAARRRVGPRDTSVPRRRVVGSRFLAPRRRRSQQGARRR